MDINVIASGSAGNTFLINDKGRSIMIDPGLSLSKIRRKTDINLANMDMCFLSHGHKDHSKSAGDICKLGVPLVASNETMNHAGINGFRKIFAKKKLAFDFKGWKVLPFDTVHDAYGPLGYLIKTPSEYKICFAIDTCYLKYKFKGVTHYIIECNYIEELLDANKSLNIIIKNRIKRSHFSLKNVVEFFKNQDLSKTQRIYLVHLSDQNSDEKIMKSTIEQLTGIPVVTA